MSPRLGRPLPAATETEAEITPTDIAEAEDAWAKDAPRGWKNLLDAEDDAQDEFTT